MNSNINFFEYLWLRTPIILMFINGYLIYRLVVITDIARIFIIKSFKKSRGSIYKLYLYIIIISAILSFFIPNTITVLTLLPVIKLINTQISISSNISQTTTLGLSLIYGANIGGMGSIIGSPANLLLIGALDFYNVPGHYKINFFNWFIWSIPLVICLIIAAWGLIVCISIFQAKHKIHWVPKSIYENTSLSDKQKLSIVLICLFFLFWITAAVFKEIFYLFSVYEPFVCLCFFIVFSWLLFIKSPGCDKPVLKLKDLINDLPKRGIIFLCVLILLIFIMHFFKIDQKIPNIFLELIKIDMSKLTIIFLTTAIVIFLTEIFSNTIVSTAFFSIAYYTSISNNIHPFIMMIAVSTASTCAFMTPVATPCNALVFGEMKGLSLFWMMISGLMLNITGVFFISGWLSIAIPLIYKLS